MESKALTVSDANKRIKELLEQDLLLSWMYISGELSNVKYYQIGRQLYFTLKDHRSQLQCVIFESAMSNIKFVPEDGMRVNIVGRISVFEKKGRYSLQVFAMEPVGIGALAAAFEQLKQRLQAEGLFSEERKRPLPCHPESIGIIASPNGAAVWDIITVARRRAPYARIYLYPATVQGEHAPQSIINALQLVRRHDRVELVILARGGGSLEELFGFNDEKLAYEIARFPIPVVSAVGHEVDFTIADFVADCRAPTPSAAAEIVFPEQEGVLDEVQRAAEQLSDRLVTLTREARLTLDYSVETIQDSLIRKTESARNRLEALCGRLEALNPLAVLKRGYSVAAVNGRIVKSAVQCQPGDTVRTELVDGVMESMVTHVEITNSKNSKA